MSKSITPSDIILRIRKFFSTQGFLLVHRGRHPRDARRYKYDLWYFDPYEKPVQYRILFIIPSIKKAKIKIGSLEYKIIKKDEKYFFQECVIELDIQKYTPQTLLLAEEINKEFNISVIISM